jgi:ERCC4-type nuclease
MSDSFVCKECGKSFSSERSLHSHFKVHGLRVVSYYQKHFPRYDLYDGKIIKFKTKGDYFSREFNTRTNQRKWLESQKPEESREYLRGIIKKRIEEKNITVAPCQVELRTLMAPSIIFYEKFFNDYYELCSSLGLEKRYVQPKQTIVAKTYKNRKDLKVYVDTREQLPLKFNIPSESRALKFGDYALNDKSLTCNCYVERKTLADFISTISVMNYDRFCREIERAKEDDAQLIVLVEESLSNALSFPFLPHISKKIKATPEYIFHKVRGLIQKYDHVQFLFVDGRKEAVRVIEKIFFSECMHKKNDLQLAYDKKTL